MPPIKENADEMRRLMELCLIAGCVFLCLNIYWYCFPFFEGWLDSEYSRVVFSRLRLTGLFSSVYVSLLIAFALFTGFCANEKGRKAADGCYKLFGGKVTVKVSKPRGWRILLSGVALLLLAPLILRLGLSPLPEFLLYSLALLLFVLLYIFGSHMVHRTLSDTTASDGDFFNEAQQSAFLQCERRIDTPVSVNIPTLYRFRNETRHGWINFVNPFRATTVMGTPGSGKSFAFINEFIRQHLRKGFSMYVYDYKFPTLTELVYNNYLKNRDNTEVYPVRPKFCMINFDDPRYSNRINPIEASSLENMTDAYESAYTIMMNLNRTWIQKQGDFFVESPINFLTAVIWYLKVSDGGRCCSLAHVVEWCGRNSAEIIAVMSTCSEIRGYMQPFYEALKNGVFEQLNGQVASVQIPLSRLRSHDMYWVVTGNDFSLDINDPKAPSVLCTGNNPDRQTVYGASLSLINGRLVKRVNHKGRLPLSLIVDELPTIFFKGIDVLIATARSNKVSICLGYQDNTQLIRDYGDKEAKVIIGTPGNIVSGQVKGDTAKNLQEMFGKNRQQTRSVNTSDESVSVNVGEKEDYMIPASRIAQLSQGHFVGIIADDVKYPISEKCFHAKIDLDIKAIDAEEKAFLPIPQVYDFNNVYVFDTVRHQASVKGLDSSLPAFVHSDAEARLVIRSFRKALKKSGGKKELALLDFIESVEKERISQVMLANTRRIERELDELLKKELEKINNDPQFEDIRNMLAKIKENEKAEG